MKAPKRFRIVLVFLGLSSITLGAWSVLEPNQAAQLAHSIGIQPAKAAAKTERASVPVTVAKAAYQDVPVAISALGAVQAWQSDLIRTRVNGKLLKVNVTEGAYVKAGELLAQIDPAPYQAALLQARGAFERDSALLANARLDLSRYQKLAMTHSISQQQVDTQTALVKQDEGLVDVDQGLVAAARLNVDYCNITSPVTGRVGVRLTDAGNLVATTDTSGIIVVNQLSPIAVTFTVPEGEFQQLLTLTEGFRKPLLTQAFSQENGTLLDTGQLTVADNKVDPSTGTIQLKAKFTNTQQNLWPGQFVNVRLTVQTLDHVISIPAAAVNQGPQGAFAYVVGPDRKAKMRPIKVQVTQDAVAVIQDGLLDGETVVTDGQVSLTPGATVAVRGGGDGGGGRPHMRKPQTP
jgi:multidrug efflux system membrane fusion protein